MWGGWGIGSLDTSSSVGRASFIKREPTCAEFKKNVSSCAEGPGPWVPISESWALQRAPRVSSFEPHAWPHGVVSLVALIRRRHVKSKEECSLEFCVAACGI